MNNNAIKTLNAIFATPTNKTIPWQDIESLFVALGAQVTNGRGSRVKFELKGKTALFHRPHNPKIARAYQVEQTRNFFMSIGVKP